MKEIDRDRGPFGTRVDIAAMSHEWQRNLWTENNTTRVMPKQDIFLIQALSTAYGGFESSMAGGT